MSYRDTSATCEECGKQFIFTVEEQRQLAERGFELTVPQACPDCRVKAEPAEGPQEGIVKWYDPEKRYGFIVQRDGNDIFFHRSGFAPGTPSELPEGTRVTYLVEQSQRGPQAVDVALMEEEA